jgi:YidC/Oxa1 family membrane protein insertase
MLTLANILQPLEDLAEAVLTFFQEDLGTSWGLAIIGLTFAVRLVLVPLSIRGIKSMRKMQLVAPQLKELQEKYKDDKERQQRELMKLYKDNGVNPLASCFPFLLQIPFFIAIFQLLNGDTFKDDVSATTAEGVDPGFFFIESVIADPKGAEMVILIALFISTTILSFLYTTSTTQTASGAQKYIFLAFPVIFAPFIATSPAGLGLYWVATNVWSLGQQVVVQRMIPAPTPPDPDDAKTEKAATVPKKAPPPPPRKKKKRR